MLKSVVCDNKLKKMSSLPRIHFLGLFSFYSPSVYNCRIGNVFLLRQLVLGAKNDAKRINR